MSGLRHNPYVGTFHGKVCHVTTNENQGVAKQFIMEDTKGNPLIGVFRHSPSVPSKSLGLKSILYRETPKAPIFSQFQVSRESKKIQPHNFLRSLRQIPTRVYSTSSVGSKSSSHSIASPDQPAEVVDANVPTCSICLDPYADGDELRTFACSHCFHNECVSKWIFHRCLDNNDLDSFNCPECRQNHITLSEAGSSRTSLAEGISSMSFLQVGENMARENGYDFLSDFGSDLQSPCPASAPMSPRFPARDASAGVARVDSGEISPLGDDQTVGSTQSRESSTSRSKPPMPFSPARRPMPLGSNFGARLSVLNKSSNRLLGIFPVPEDSYCVSDSTFRGARSPSSASSTTATTSASASAAAGGAAEHHLFGASALLAVSSMSTGSTHSTTRASSVPPPVSVPLPAWASMDPLCASEYSDCGAPLNR